MGLFSSITDAITSPIKSLTTSLFGSSDQINWISPSQLVEPPSKEETNLLRRLYTTANTSLGFANTLNTQSFNYLKKALDSVNKISQGQLPDSYKRAVEFRFKQDLGGILDNYAKRGIVNSSITQKAINDALSKANDLSVNYLNQALSLAQAPYLLATSAKNDYLQLPSNLYSQLNSSRYRITAQPIIRSGSPGLLTSALGGAASGLGFRLGSSLFGLL